MASKAFVIEGLSRVQGIFSSLDSYIILIIGIPCLCNFSPFCNVRMLNPVDDLQAMAYVAARIHLGLGSPFS